jgi:hypothetical protein
LELDLDMSQLATVRLDTNVSPKQGATTSSSSIHRGGLQVRAAAAEARQALLLLASTRLIHASRSANRFEALEPVRQGVHRCFGAIAPGVARGLKLRHDHGSNYMSGDFQDEIECFPENTNDSIESRSFETDTKRKDEGRINKRTSVINRNCPQPRAGTTITAWANSRTSTSSPYWR